MTGDRCFFSGKIMPMDEPGPRVGFRGRSRTGRLPHSFLWFVLFLSLVAGSLSASSPGNDAGPVFRFAVIGDSGTGKRPQYTIAERLLEQHQRSPLETVLMLGDNIYERGDPKDYRAKFELPYASLLSAGIEFRASLGNHDVRGSHWREAIKYPLFHMNGKRYYSFGDDSGLVQFFALDTNGLDRNQESRSFDGGQVRWLRGELESSTARWKIAFFHHPLYSSGGRHGSSNKVRQAIEQTLVDGGVRLVFSGHDHVYERVLPQRGILYFVSGAAAKLRKGNLKKSSPLLGCGNDQMRSFMVLELDRDEARFETIGEGGEVLDRGILSYTESGSSRLDADCNTAVGSISGE